MHLSLTPLEQLAAWIGIYVLIALGRKAGTRTSYGDSGSWILTTTQFFLWGLLGLYLLAYIMFPAHGWIPFVVLAVVWTLASFRPSNLLPVKPWTVGMVLFFGQPTFETKRKPGYRLVPPGYGLERIIGGAADLNFPHERVMTRDDQAESHVMIRMVIFPALDNLQQFQKQNGIARNDKGEVDIHVGVPGIIENILSEELRAWAIDEFDGPGSYFELRALQPQMNVILLDHLVNYDKGALERLHAEGLISERQYEIARGDPLRNENPVDPLTLAVVSRPILNVASFGVLMRFSLGHEPTIPQRAKFGAIAYDRRGNPVGDPWQKLLDALAAISPSPVDINELKKVVLRREALLRRLGSGGSSLDLYSLGIVLDRFNVAEVHQTGKLKEAIEQIGVERVQRESQRLNADTMKRNIDRLARGKNGLAPTEAARYIAMQDGAPVTVNEQVVKLEMDPDSAKAIGRGGSALTAALAALGLLKKKGGTK